MTTNPSGHLVGYSRISTADQDTALQRDALNAVQCTKIYEDTASGKSTNGRPELAAMLAYVRAGDTVVVWKIDRLARSLTDLLRLADDLKTRGVGLKVLTGALSGIDTATADGRLMLAVLGGVAEFERELIRERTVAGQQAAKAQGRKLGRPAAMDEDKAAAARSRRERGESIAQIAKALGVGRSTVYRLFADEEPSEQAA